MQFVWGVFSEEGYLVALYESKADAIAAQKDCEREWKNCVKFAVERWDIVPAKQRSDFENQTSCHEI